MPEITKCPNCLELVGKKFDGWDCKVCGYSLPQKARKAFGKIVQGVPDFMKDCEDI